MPVFTIIQHEPDFFPIWYAHYSKHFGPDEIYVLHHKLPRPKSESQEARKASWDLFISNHQREHSYHLIDIHNDKSFDHEWLKLTVMRFQGELLKNHDWVLFAEVDEIIAPHPDLGIDIKTYAAAKLKTTATCITDGYEVVQNLDQELPIDFSKPLLPQRQWWYWSKMYSKPLLSSVPLRWCWGFHACDEIPVPYHQRDRELLLIHLHKIDWDLCLRRHQSNSEREWKDGSFGYQNRLIVESRLRQWWSINIDQKNSLAEFTSIPESLKSII